MRFFKIFLISFFSLIGVFGTTYGIMYAVGAFDTPVVKPEDISISLSDNSNNPSNCFSDASDIFTSGDFYLVVNTTTPDVTENLLNLSLSGTITNNTSTPGIVSNGVVSIPTTAKIGEEFKVTLATGFKLFYNGANDTVGTLLEWIMGGHCSITATSVGNNLLLPISTNVHVDVPVYNFTAQTIPVGFTQPATTYSINSKYKINGVFQPTESQYAYSYDGKNNYSTKLKNVYVREEIATSSYIERFGTDNFANTFNVKSVANDVSISTYVFKKAIDEKLARKEYDDMNAIYANTYSENTIYSNLVGSKMESLATGTNAKVIKEDVEVDFIKLSDLEYTTTTDDFTFRINRAITLFAKSNVAEVMNANLNLGFSSVSGNNLDLNSEIANIAIALQKQNPSSNLFDFVSDWEPTKYGEIKKVKLNADGALDNNGQEINCYTAQLSETDIKQSLWEFTFEGTESDGNYRFVVVYVGNTVDTTMNSKTKLIEFNVVETISNPIAWGNTDAVERVVNYTKATNEGTTTYNPFIAEYDFKKYGEQSNLVIPVENDFTTTRFFIYTTEETDGEGDEKIPVDLTQYYNCTKSNNTIVIAGSGNAQMPLYELPNGILSVKSGKERDVIGKNIHVIYATIKTDANGIVYEDDAYVIDQWSKKPETETHSDISVNFVDSLQDLFTTMTISTGETEPTLYYVKNEKVVDEVSATGSPYKLAFAQNQQNVFVLDLSSVDDNTLLINEIEAGKISFVAYIKGTTNDITSQVISYNHMSSDKTSEDYTKYMFSIKQYSNAAGFIEFDLKVVYSKTGQTFLIDSFNTKDKTTAISITCFEVFTGKAVTAYFGDDTKYNETTNKGVLDLSTQDNAIIVETIIGEDVEIDYLLKIAETGDPISIKDILFVTNNNVTTLNMTFKDKYDVVVTNPANIDFALQSSNTQVLLANNGPLSLLKSNEKVELSLVLNGEVKDKLVFIQAEQSSHLNSIDKKMDVVASDVVTTESLVNIYSKTELSQDSYDFANQIETQFFGQKERKVNLFATKTGDDRQIPGLLTIKYKEDNKDAIDISSSIVYSLYRNIDADLHDMITFSNGTTDYTKETFKVGVAVNNFTFKDHFGADATFYLKAEIKDLGISQIVQVTIKANLVINMTSRGIGLQDAKPVTNNSILYTGIFGATDLMIDMTAKLILSEESEIVSLYYTKTNNSSTISFEEGSDDSNTKVCKITFANVTKYSTESFTFASYNGEANKNVFKYSRTFNYNVNPNVKIFSINSNIIQNDNGSFIPVGLVTYNTTTPVLPTNGAAINISVKAGYNNIATTNSPVVIGEIINNNFVAVDRDACHFKYDETVFMIKTKVNAPTTYKLVLGYKDGNNIYQVQYGEAIKSVVVGSGTNQTTYYYVEITISPDIVTNKTGDNAKMFITYNGKEYLKLLSDNKYSTAKEDAVGYVNLTKYFTTTDNSIGNSSIENSSTIQGEPYTKNGNKYDVHTLYNIDTLFGLNYYILLNKVDSDGNVLQTLKYPVLFVPNDLPFAKEHNTNVLSDYIDEDDNVITTETAVTYVRDVDNKKQIVEEKDFANLLNKDWLKQQNVYYDYFVNNKSVKMYSGNTFDISNIVNLGVGYTYTIYDENPWAISRYASILVEGSKAYIKTSIVPEDKFVVLIATKNGNVDSKLSIPIRIKLCTSADVQVVYPYDYLQKAEYIDLGTSPQKVIDLTQVQNAYVPYKSALGQRRFDVTNKNIEVSTDDVVVNLQNLFNDERITLSYSIKELTEIEYTNISDYATLSGSTLTIINKGVEDYSIVVTITAKNTLGDIVAKQDYVFTIFKNIELTIEENADGTNTNGLDKDGVYNSSTKSFNITKEILGDTNTITGFDEWFAVSQTNGSITLPVDGTNDVYTCFYIADNENNIIEAKQDNNNKYYVEHNVGTLVDINTYLIVYTRYGEIRRYPYTLASAIVYKDIVAIDTPVNEKQISVISGVSEPLTTYTVNDIKILSLTTTAGTENTDDDIVGVVSSDGRTATLTYSNGAVSTITITNGTGTDYVLLNCTPFAYESKLTLSIRFSTQDNKQTVTKNFDVTLNAGISSNFVNTPAEDVSDINAGTVYAADIESLLQKTYSEKTLFTLTSGTYNYDVSAVDNASMVEFNNNSLLRVKSSVVDGNVLIRVRAYTGTSVEDATFYVDSYLKLKVKANAEFEAHYDHNQLSEYVATGTKVDLTKETMFNTLRTSISSDGASNYFIKQTYADNASSGLVDDYNAFATEMTITSPSSGSVTISVYYKTGESGSYCYDIVGSYIISVKATWGEILNVAVKNFDGSSNTDKSPEIYASDANRLAKQKLDIADYDTAKAKQYVFDINEENAYLNKSEIYFNPNTSTNVKIDNSKFTCEVDSANITVLDDQSTLIPVIIKTTKGNEIGLYYVKFAFSTSITRHDIEMAPGTNGDIKDLFGITCGNGYTVEIAETESQKIDYKLFLNKGTDQLPIWEEAGDEYKGLNYKNYLTFENNAVIPTLAAYGAPNGGVKLTFQVKVTYQTYTQSVVYDLSVIVKPNWTVNFTSDNININVWGDNNSKTEQLATLDLSNSIIQVSVPGQTQNLLIGNFNVTSDNSLVQCSSNNSVLTIVATKPTMGTQIATLTFVDNYGYLFTFAITLTPEAINIPTFNTTFTEFEGDTLSDLKSNISFSDKKNIIIDEVRITINEGSSSKVYSTKNTKENGITYGKGTVTINTVPYDDIISITLPSVSTTSDITGTISFVLKKGEDAQATISSAITIKLRYMLVKNQDLMVDGQLYLTDEQSLSLYDLYNIVDRKESGSVYGQRNLVKQKSMVITPSTPLTKNVTLYQSAYNGLDFGGSCEIISSDPQIVFTIANGKMSVDIGDIIGKVKKNNDIETLLTDLSLYNYSLIFKNEHVEKVFPFTNNDIVNNNNKLIFESSELVDYFTQSGDTCSFNGTIEAAFVWQDKNAVTKLITGEITNYATGEQSPMHIFPLESLGFASNGGNYYHYSVVNESTNVPEFTYLSSTYNNKEIISIVDDYVLNINTAKDDTKTITVKVARSYQKENGNDVVGIEINCDKVQNRISLFAKGLMSVTDGTNTYPVTEVKLYTGDDNDGTYYNGLTEIDLKTIKKLAIKGKNTEGQDVDITAPLVAMISAPQSGLFEWTDGNSFPKYYTSNSEFSISYNNGQKVFTDNLNYRITPSVAYIANSLGQTTFNTETGFYTVRSTKTLSKTTGEIEEVISNGETISFNEWANVVTLLDAKKNFILNKQGNAYSLYNYVSALSSSSKIKITVKVKEQDTAKAEIVTGNDLKIKAGFDWYAGHITIEVYALRLDGTVPVYEEKLGEIIMLPRIAVERKISVNDTVYAIGNGADGKIVLTNKSTNEIITASSSTKITIEDTEYTIGSSNELLTLTNESNVFTEIG